MRNQHIIVVNAESPVAACRKVERELTDWGGTYVPTIFGCVSEDDEPYHNDDVALSKRDRVNEVTTLEQFN